MCRTLHFQPNFRGRRRYRASDQRKKVVCSSSQALLPDSCDSRGKTFSIYRQETGKQTEKERKKSTWCRNRLLPSPGPQCGRTTKGLWIQKQGRRLISRQTVLYSGRWCFWAKRGRRLVSTARPTTEQEPTEQGTHTYTLTDTGLWPQQQRLSKKGKTQKKEAFSGSILRATPCSR